MATDASDSMGVGSCSCNADAATPVVMLPPALGGIVVTGLAAIGIKVVGFDGGCGVVVTHGSDDTCGCGVGVRDRCDGVASAFVGASGVAG